MKILSKITSVVLMLTMLLSINVFQVSAEDASVETSSSLYCYVNAMGGIDFGAGMVTDTELVVDETNKTSLKVTIAPVQLTIYGTTVDVAISEPDNETKFLEYWDGEAWQNASYTTTTSGETTYVNSITFPITSAKESYNLGVYISSMMSYQFGGSHASAISSGNLEAILNVTWSDEDKETVKTLNATDSSLYCYVNAMGGIDFGAGMVTDTELVVNEANKTSLKVTFAPVELTIYGITVDVAISEPDNETKFLEYKDGDTWYNASYTTKTISSTADDGTSTETTYVNSITFPVTAVKESYNLGVYISSMMSYQFGGSHASAISSGDLEAILNVTLSDEDKDKVKTLNRSTEFGTSKTAFAPGIYKLPVSMMKSTDITSASMAGSCIGDAVLTVKSDGTALISIDIKPVTVFGVTGYANDWGIYQTLSTEGEPTKTLYTTGDDGNVNTITFAVPDNTWDGVYANMYVAAMNMNTDAFLAFDYVNACEYIGIESISYNQEDANVGITNGGNNNISGIVIVAHYNSTGALLEMNSVPAIIVGGDNIITVPEASNNETVSVKVMLWDSFTTLKPLTKAYTN